MREYDQLAAWYAAERHPEVGVAEARAALAGAPRPATVLDLGCGTGAPIAVALVADGHRVVGVDSSAAMIERFRAAVPTADARHQRVQDVALPPASLDAVVAWGVLFHLDAADQRETIRRVARWLRPGGRFLFTSGLEAGERRGTMNGEPFRYRSLGAGAYREAAEAAGLRLVRASLDPWENAVYVAERVAGATP